MVIFTQIYIYTYCTVIFIFNVKHINIVYYYLNMNALSIIHTTLFTVFSVPMQLIKDTLYTLHEFYSNYYLLQPFFTKLIFFQFENLEKSMGLVIFITGTHPQRPPLLIYGALISMGSIQSNHGW